MEEVFAGTDWMEMEILGWIHFMSRATLNCKVRHCRQVHTVGCARFYICYNISSCILGYFLGVSST